MIVSSSELVKSIDHTILKSQATVVEVGKACQLAKKLKFAAMFVSPCYVKLAAELLATGTTKVGTAVGFPLGTQHTTAKCFEAINSIVHGAEEIDFVLNVGFLKAGRYEDVYQEMRAIVLAAKRQQLKDNIKHSIITKVIIEAGLLTEQEKKMACKLAEKARVDFVKTSTGFNPEAGGATQADVRLLRRNLPLTIGVKASGGIRTTEQALMMLEAGANRIGTSAGVQIIEGYKELAMAKK
ncbi:MAG: deoxyribose-phosphate aldolase [Actinobacteria bacterium]|nr:MAG: deoxyribose-phosphate aldolase [Actinomycetota bacterium]